MSAALRHPPGRSGRLWLRRRLSAARRGADLLDRKLRILRQEEQRLTVLAERTRADWQAACSDAEMWFLRAAVIGGERGVRPDAASDPTTVDVTWASIMGIRYPSRATCQVPPERPRSPVTATAALPPARAAFEVALHAAVAHAAAAASVGVVAAEIATTRSRLRALEERWVPRLEQSLGRLEAALEEVESGEAVRLRWAAARQHLAGRRPARPADARTDGAEASP